MNDLEKKAFKQKLMMMLMELDPKEETVLRQRLGFGAGRMRSLEEVSLFIGVTRERIRQIEQKALEKMYAKDPQLKSELQKYLDTFKHNGAGGTQDSNNDDLDI